MKRMLSALCAVCLWGVCAYAQAQHLDETTQEVRTILYYHVAPATLAKVLPPGWVVDDLKSGPARGANLTVNLSDQLASASPGRTLAGDARGQGVTISARVRNLQSGVSAAMVLLGFTNGVDVPGPYGLHRRAVIAMERRALTQPDGSVRVNEHWLAQSAPGEGIDVELAFTRGTPAALHLEQQTRSGLHPDFYRIYKMDEQADVARSVAQGIDRVMAVDVSAQGAVLPLLDGTQKLMAVVSAPVFHREIWLPD
jgi:hypothetical protein